MSARNGLSSAKRDALERLLCGDGSVRTPEAIRPRPANAVVPISAEQEHVWLHATMAADVPLYNEAITIHRYGLCDVGLLEASFNEVMRRHEIWRTGFAAGSHGIVQRVHEDIHLRLPLTDLTGLPPPEREAAALQIAIDGARLPFDLSQAPLLRGRIVKLSDSEHRLYLTLHHIIFDGVSIYHVLLPTLAAIYEDLVAGYAAAVAGPAAPALQYGDYALWRAAQLESDAIAQQLAYWSETLAGELPVLHLPTDHTPPRPPTYRGDMATFALSAELTDRLKRTSLELGVTLYGLLLTGFQTLLFRYTGQTDLIIGGVVDMRRHRSLEPLMGYFLNSLPIRTRPAPGMSFRDYARQTSGAVVDMLAAGDVPFSRLVRTLQPRRSAVSHPLFQILFSIEPPAPQCAEGWDLTQMDVPVGSAKFDLYLELDERPEGLIGRFLYSTDLFEPSTINRMIGHWRTLLEAAVADPECALEHLPMLTLSETIQMAGWNDTVQAVPDAPLNALFETRARSMPDAVAVVSAGRTYTYGDLNRRADDIAGWLCRAGVRPGALVAVCLGRSVDMIAALLATLKAGAAYMPLDPTLPAARLSNFLHEGAVTILLTRAHLLTELPQLADVLLLDDLAGGEARSAPLPPPSGPDDLAYVLCTSGTTGRPKAVEITHRAVVNLLMAMQGALCFSPADSLLAVTTVSFDIAALELFLPLVSGGRVILADRETAVDPFRLAEQIRQTRPTVMQATPSTWRALVDAGWPGLPGLRILVGGEALPRDLAAALLRRADSVWNLYGPTETTIWSTVHPVQAGSGAVPIGQPIANTTAFVLDPHGNQVPIGVPGELYLGGAGVARGYRNQTALTRQRFTTPAAIPGQRVYRTGDIVRRRRDGTLDWVGRNDDQTKIRGHRVEPGEVEAALTALPGVLNAAVVARADAGGFIQLVAHVVAPGLETTYLRAALTRQLPNYMVPASFVFHNTLPLTANGKLDRRQLPAPHEPVSGETEPKTETERRLAGLWKTILGLNEIELAADFFALGGHSLLAIRLLIAIEAEFGCRISTLTLYQSPTIESLAAVVEAHDAGNQVAPMRAHAPVAEPQGAPFNARDATKLRLVRRARGVSRGSVLGMPGYTGHTTEIGIIAANALEDYDVWAFAIDTNGRQLMEDEAWLACAREMADRLVAKDDLNPRAIIGFSLGGFMAWLVERLVVAAGGKATPIINFDGSAWHVDNEDLLGRMEPLLPPIRFAERPTMLLLHRQPPGNFELIVRSDIQWARAGANLTKLTYRTLSHLDVVSPAAIAASRGALVAFIETGRVGLATPPQRLSFDTIGGTLFRFFDCGAPPDAKAIQALAEGTTLPKDDDDTVRLPLLFLAAATGDAEMALMFARRMATEKPEHRASTYVQVALLSELERTEEARALAESWCRVNPSDRAMLARAIGARPPPAPWGSVEGLVIGSDESLDFAVRVVRYQGRTTPTIAAQMLGRPLFTGEDTVGRFERPCFLQIDLAYVCPPHGLLISGWIFDPFDAIAGMTMRCGSRSALLDPQQWIRVPRPDVYDSFVDKFGGVSPKCGFITYLPDVYVPGEAPYVEVETIRGEVGLKSMAAVCHADADAIRTMLAGFDLRYDEVVRVYDRVLGPAIEAIDSSWLGNRVSSTHLTFGAPPPAPLVSIIVPLCGPIDVMEHQLAGFSKTLSKDHEVIYVLGDPAKLQATEALAASCLARFQHPFSLVVSAENVGSAAAKNIGLAVAAGRYSCFLNASVVPKDPRWLDHMLDTAETNPAIGVVGAVLVDDETNEHRDGGYETLPKVGGWIFCMQPNKGLVLQDREAGASVERVTGACFLTPTDLARAVNGFDESYFIGEFEDADLCEKAKAQGRICVVDRRARLHDLERQPENGPEPAWRLNLNLYNAWRFQRRWADAWPRARLHETDRGPTSGRVYTREHSLVMSDMTTAVR